MVLCSFLDTKQLVLVDKAVNYILGQPDGMSPAHILLIDQVWGRLD